MVDQREGQAAVQVRSEAPAQVAVAVDQAAPEVRTSPEAEELPEVAASEPVETVPAARSRRFFEELADEFEVPAQRSPTLSARAWRLAMNVAARVFVWARARVQARPSRNQP